jgi:hypothetical protein
VVEDASVIRPGDGAQLDATVFDLKRLHLLGAVRAQAVLQIDAGEQSRELAEIGRRRADQAGELAEAPVGWCDRYVSAGQRKRQTLGVVAAGLYPDGRALDGSGSAAFGPTVDGDKEVRQGQVALIRWPREPLRGYATDPLAAADVDLVAAGTVASGVENFNVGHG